MPSTSRTTTRTTLVLCGYADWDEWIAMIKSTANIADIWEFVDPDQETPKLLIAPVKTTLADVKAPVAPATITVLSHLNDSERALYMVLLEDYRMELKKYEKKKELLAELHLKIQETVERRSIHYILQHDTPYTRLKALKSRFAPTNNTREYDVRLAWDKIQKPGTQNYDQWINDFETAYDNCVRHGLPETFGDRGFRAFYAAIKPIDPIQSTTAWNLKSLKGPEWTVKDAIQEYRIYRRECQSDLANQKGSHGAFPATFQGKSTDGKAAYPCFCDTMHKYRECPYICEDKRPEDWTADPKHQKKLESILAGDSIQANAIKSVRNRVANGTWKDYQSHSGGKQHQGKSNKQAARPDPAALFTVHRPGKNPDCAMPVMVTSEADEKYELFSSFICDSGATIHVCNQKDRMTNMIPSDGGFLLAGATRVPIEGYGTATINAMGPRGPQVITVSDTAYVPGFHTSVISLDRLVEKGVYWDNQSNVLKWEKNGKSTILAYTPKKFRQWVLEYNLVDRKELENPVFLAHSSKSAKPTLDGTAEQWHDRLGHLYPEAILHLASQSEGVKLTTTKFDPACEVCRLADSKSINSRRSPERATVPLYKVHWDLIQMKKATGQEAWILHLIDDMTRMNFVYILPNKRQQSVVGTLEAFVQEMKTQWHYTVRALHYDGETALGKEWDELIAKSGIMKEVSAPYTPAQNGLAERSGGVILNRATKLRLSGNLPELLWPEIVKATGYLLNRSPTKSLNWETPIGLLRRLSPYAGPKAKPTISHLRAFGCRAYAFIKNRPRLDKLLPKAHIGYLIGYDSTNIYRIWIPSIDRVISTRDVTFDESKRFHPSEITPVSEEIIETLEIPRLQGLDDDSEPETSYLPMAIRNMSMADGTKNTGMGDVGNRSIGTSAAENPAPDDFSSDDQLPTPEPTPEPGSPPIAYEAPIPESFEPLDTPEEPTQPEPSTLQAPRGAFARQPPAPKDIRGDVSEENILTDKRQRVAKKQAYAVSVQTLAKDSAFHTAFSLGTGHHQAKIHRTQLPPPPKGWKEALQHPHGAGFKAAGMKEYSDLQKMGTFEKVAEELVTSFVLPLIWVFTYKFDTDGFLVKYKARIVVRGDLQHVGDKDTYAATLAARVFRTLMAIAAYFGLEAEQLDAINAFLNSLLDEKVYVRYPSGFYVPGYVLRLNRALYGLPRSPLLWFTDLSKQLAKLGLTAVPETTCLFTSKDLVVFFFVDDICVLFHQSKRGVYEKFRADLLEAYNMREMGELKWFLGIRILRDREQHTLWLCQDSYIEKMAHRFGLTKKRAPKTPMHMDPLLPNEGEATAHYIHEYQQKVGSITYATAITRPDATRASQKLAEFLQNPSEEHMEAADRLICYLYHTRTYAIKYGSTDLAGPSFQAAGDAAYADDVETRHSTEGYCVHLFGGPIDWKCVKQSTVTTSTTEAELLALSHVSAWVLWYRRLFDTIQLHLEQDYSVQCDNLQTVRLMIKDTPKLVTKLKHVDIHQHWLREHVAKGDIKIEWIPTGDMPADGLTKALPIQKHQAFVKQLNMEDIKTLLALGA